MEERMGPANAAVVGPVIAAGVVLLFVSVRRRFSRPATNWITWCCSRVCYSIWSMALRHLSWHTASLSRPVCRCRLRTARS